MRGGPIPRRAGLIIHSPREEKKKNFCRCINSWPCGARIAVTSWSRSALRSFFFLSSLFFTKLDRATGLETPSSRFSSWTMGDLQFFGLLCLEVSICRGHATLCRGLPKLPPIYSWLLFSRKEADLDPKNPDSIYRKKKATDGKLDPANEEERERLSHAVCKVPPSRNSISVRGGKVVGLSIASAGIFKIHDRYSFFVSLLATPFRGFFEVGKGPTIESK